MQKDYEGMQMKSSREQFEEWIANTTSSDLHRSIMLDKCKNGSYRHLATENKWEAWQASRAAIEIELPAWDEYDTTRQYQEATQDKLESKGLKVKS